MKQMQGGTVLNSGTDTCVFSPPVKCAKKSKTVGKQEVSRVVVKSQRSFREIAVEDTIRQLEVQQKEPWKSFLKNHIVISRSQCEPDITSSDLMPQDKFQKCTGLRKLQDKGGLATVNASTLALQTPRQDTDASTFFRVRRSLRELVQVFVDVSLAALYLTAPRNDMMIVHFDLHPGNVAIRKGRGALTDFGRSAVFKSVDNASRWLNHVLTLGSLSMDYTKELNFWTNEWQSQFQFNVNVASLFQAQFSLLLRVPFRGVNTLASSEFTSAFLNDDSEQLKQVIYKVFAFSDFIGLIQAFQQQFPDFQAFVDPSELQMLVAKYNSLTLTHEDCWHFLSLQIGRFKLDVPKSLPSKWKTV